MSSITWGKFYWADWRSDPKLRLCSFAARGLWMDLLCICAESVPAGYVAIGKNGLSNADIAKVVGAPLSEIEPLLSELERNDVFSRTARGTIYSRRMLRDEKRTKIARENGKRGGVVTGGKIKCLDGSLKQNSSDPPSNSLVIPDTRYQRDDDNDQDSTQLKDSADPQKADRRSRESRQIYDEPIGPEFPRQPKSPKGEPPGFAEFWDAYGHKVGRKDAVKAFVNAIKKTPLSVIMAAIAPHHAATYRQYWPHPATWLNAERWNDEYGPAVQKPAAPANGPAWGQMLESYRRNGLWPWVQVSPPPGAPGCKIPPEILDEFKNPPPKPRGRDGPFPPQETPEFPFHADAAE